MSLSSSLSIPSDICTELRVRPVRTLASAWRGYVGLGAMLGLAVGIRHRDGAVTIIAEHPTLGSAEIDVIFCGMSGEITPVIHSGVDLHASGIEEVLRAHAAQVLSDLGVRWVEVR